MKKAEQLMSEFNFGHPDYAKLTIQNIRAIQADALREAAEICVGIRRHWASTAGNESGAAMCEDKILARAEQFGEGATMKHLFKLLLSKCKKCGTKGTKGNRCDLCGEVL